MFTGQGRYFSKGFASFSMRISCPLIVGNPSQRSDVSISGTPCSKIGPLHNGVSKQNLSDVNVAKQSLGPVHARSPQPSCLHVKTRPVQLLCLWSEETSLFLTQGLLLAILAYWLHVLSFTLHFLIAHYALQHED